MAAAFPTHSDIFHDVTYIDERDRMTVPKLFRPLRRGGAGLELPLELLSDAAARVTSVEVFNAETQALGTQKGIKAFDALRFVSLKLDDQGRATLPRRLSVHLRIRARGPYADDGAVHFLASPELKLIMGDLRFRELISSRFANTDTL